MLLVSIPLQLVSEKTPDQRVVIFQTGEILRQGYGEHTTVRCDEQATEAGCRALWSLEGEHATSDPKYRSGGLDSS